MLQKDPEGYKKRVSAAVRHAYLHACMRSKGVRLTARACVSLGQIRQLVRKSLETL